MIRNTSTDQAPWFVIPADKKWYRNYLISGIVVEHLERLKMAFPTLSTNR
jgi:polyphosphate kinase 2 (PPK2 family)